jgi:hypothetical protein
VLSFRIHACVHVMPFCLRTIFGSSFSKTFFLYLKLLLLNYEGTGSWRWFDLQNARGQLKTDMGQVLMLRTVSNMNTLPFGRGESPMAGTYSITRRCLRAQILSSHLTFRLLICNSLFSLVLEGKVICVWYRRDAGKTKK